MSLIKVVTFDMWNTLVKDKDYTDQRVKCLADSLLRSNVKRTYDEIRKAYMTTQEYVRRVWRDEDYRFVPVEVRLEHTLKRLSARLPKDRRLRVLKELRELAVMDPPELVEGIKETLDPLSSKYKLGVICDTGFTPGIGMREILARHGILRFFSATVFSDENGYCKPHRTMFEKVLDKLSVEPSQTVHVGDLLHTDIAGAKAAGMKAVWFNTTRKINLGRIRPDYEIGTFPEIVMLLERMS